MDNKKRVVFMYDFDKTLATKYSTEFTFNKMLGVSDKDFWHYCNNVVTKEYNMESNIAFLFTCLMMAKERKIKLTQELLSKLGKDIEFFPGVDKWFTNINKYGKKLGLQVEHYIISSGISEIIEGTNIAKYFNKIFASSYVYDQNGEAFWPRNIVNYTTKTQYIYRIKKNSIDEIWEDTIVNKKIRNKDEVIPFENMIYIGDGFTDVPSMQIVQDNGGNSICVYAEGEQHIADNLLNDERVNHVAKADYRMGSELTKITKQILDNIAKNSIK